MVRISTSEVSVRCTGHLSAISSNRSRCSGVEVAPQRDGALDAVDHSFLGLAGLAIGGMDSAVAELDGDALERQRLALGVEPKRHRRAGAQSGEHEIVRTRAAVEAADSGRLVRQETMPPTVTCC